MSKLLFFCVYWGLFLPGVWARASSTENPPCVSNVSPGKISLKKPLNVKDFGAVGDGVHDDTACIQAAFNYFWYQKPLLAQDKNSIEYTDLGFSLYSAPGIYFPYGVYVITKSINSNSSLNVYSDSKAVIKQLSDDQDIFHFGTLRRASDDPKPSPAYKAGDPWMSPMDVTIRGLSFVGGANQVYLENQNVDGSRFNLVDDVFNSAHQFAVKTHGSGPDGHMSAQLNITGCKFMYPAQVLDNVCDNAVVRDSWVEIGDNNGKGAKMSAGKGAFVNEASPSPARLTLDGVIATPSACAGDPTSKDSQCTTDTRIKGAHWVTNYGGSVRLINSRFGAEFSGMAIIHQRPNLYYKDATAKYLTYEGSDIDIENSFIYSGFDTPFNDSGVIVLEHSPPFVAVPQHITIRHTQGMYNVPWIRDAASSITADQMDSIDHEKTRFMITIQDNLFYMPDPKICGTSVKPIPDALQSYVSQGSVYTNKSCNP